MDINHLLTNRNPAGLGRNMQMQYELAPPQMAMSAGNYAQNLYVPASNRIKSEGTGSDRGASPHVSDHSRYNSQTPQNAVPTFQQISALSNFPSQIQQHQQQHTGMSMLQNAYQPTPVQEQYHQQQQQQQAVSMGSVPPPDESGRASTGSTGLPKAFACSTCQKGFARRSDLARHERIHSGVRPHVCDHPGCGKQFIQRSALTVHSRVHTGEKPHMCERCGKPFSDSSSLARHRRIHSGKRPYKCPYADCQKTFTRRTTLTRHQNHHTGTIEESEAATAAALASRSSVHNQRSRGSDEENDFSGDAKSPMPQQPDRQTSASPATGMNGAPMQQRQDYYMSAMNSASMVPAHMRNELQPSPRPQSPAHAPYSMGSNGSQGRPSLTSNPSSVYNPPQILEPPAINGQQQNGSGHNSPHMSGTLGEWQSPHNGMSGPPTTEYTYPTDVNNGVYNTASTMYYQAPNVQRPHSTGPLDHYNPNMRQEMWAQQQ